MNNYSFREKLAQELLDISLEYDKFRYYILTWPGYEVYVNDGTGRKVDSKLAKLNAIYEKYRTDNTIAEKLYAALELNLDTVKYGGAILDMLELIRCQMRSESENKAPFHMDCHCLIEKAKANIARNKKLYVRPMDDYPNGFMQAFRDVDSNLRNSYGCNIL